MLVYIALLLGASNLLRLLHYLSCSILNFIDQLYSLSLFLFFSPPHYYSSSFPGFITLYHSRCLLLLHRITLHLPLFYCSSSIPLIITLPHSLVLLLFLSCAVYYSCVELLLHRITLHLPLFLLLLFNPSHNYSSSFPGFITLSLLRGVLLLRRITPA